MNSRNYINSRKKNQSSPSKLWSVMREVPQMQIDEGWKVVSLKHYYPILYCSYSVSISICSWSLSDWGCWTWWTLSLSYEQCPYNSAPHMFYLNSSFQVWNLNHSLLAEESYWFILYNMLHVVSKYYL